MSNVHETILAVSGMTCQSCVRRVTAALRAVPGVSEVEVRRADGQALVRHDPATAPTSALIAAVEKAGYRSGLAAAA
jgi:copper chaperone CopZ